jgi:hypothetical protein
LFGCGIGLFVGAIAACSSFTSEAPPADGGSEAATADGPTTAEDGGAQPEGAIGDGAATGVTVLASGYTDLAGITADESTDYFIDRAAMGTIRSVPIAGGTVSPVAVTNARPSSIVSTPAAVFWGDPTTKALTRWTKVTGALDSITPTDKGPVALAVANDRIVVAALGAGTMGDVQQYDFNFTSGPSVMSQDNPWDVTVASGTTIYWTENGTGAIWQGMTGVGTAKSRVNGETGCESIASNSSGLYWTRPAFGVVRRLNAAGLVDAGTAEEIANGQQQPFSLAADASGVYWMVADGMIRHLDISDVVATLVNPTKTTFDDHHIQAIALTTKYVVWITSDGQVLRTDKR